VIAAPNPQAFQFGLMGRYWTHLDAPRHLHLIPAATTFAHGAGPEAGNRIEHHAGPGRPWLERLRWGMTFANASANWALKRGFRLIGRVVGQALHDGRQRRGARLRLHRGVARRGSREVLGPAPRATARAARATRSRRCGGSDYGDWEIVCSRQRVGGRRRGPRARARRCAHQVPQHEGS